VTVSLNPPPSGRRQSNRRVGFWLAIAALIHAELALLIGFGLYALAPSDADLKRELAARNGPESIDISAVDDDAAREILADLERQEEKRKAEEVKKEVDSIKAPGQVVDVPVPREERRPDEAEFASEHDATVDHETKKYGKFDDKARQGDTSGEADRSKPETPRSPEVNRRLAMRDPQLGRSVSRTPGPDAPQRPQENAGSQYGVPSPGAPTPEGVVSPFGKSTPERPSGGSAQPGGLAALMPSDQQLAKAIGTGTQDALKDIDDGDETALNSKRWRFSAFFNRLKKQVADHWHPEEAYRRRDPTGQVYGSKNRLTILRVQLKPDGTLANVALEQPSGVEFLDDEAIEAFKQAQPFPNPPRQLLDSGTINFRFGFLFELSGAPRMRLFRYND
jgi:TonB family protein